MIELRWRRAEGFFKARTSEDSFGEGSLTNVFVSTDPNSIELATGHHVVLQIRYRNNEWLDVPVGGE